jgi:AbrB family looped-hinge helix DNA binding protein
MPATKIGRRGQITLPKKVRQWLDISEGDRVIFLREGDDVKIKPIRRTLLDLRGVIPVSGPQDFEVIRRKVISERAKERSTGE